MTNRRFNFLLICAAVLGVLLSVGAAWWIQTHDARYLRALPPAGRP